MRNLFAVFFLLIPTAAIAQGVVVDETISEQIDYEAATPAGGSEMVVRPIASGAVNYFAGSSTAATDGAATYIAQRIAHARSVYTTRMLMDGHVISGVPEELVTTTATPAAQQTNGSWLVKSTYSVTFVIVYTPSGGVPCF